MTEWWCPLCPEWTGEPEWSDSARPLPYHLLGASMHGVRRAGGDWPDGPLIREVATTDQGVLVTIEAGETP